MVTNYPHPVASSEGISGATEEAHVEGFSVIDRLHQLFCGLHGHDALLQFEQDRMFLKCASCGHETPGWALNEVPPTVTICTCASAAHQRAPQCVVERDARNRQIQHNAPGPSCRRRNADSWIRDPMADDPGAAHFTSS